jgi:hypothetical protein
MKKHGIAKEHDEIVFKSSVRFLDVVVVGRASLFLNFDLAMVNI